MSLHLDYRPKTLNEVEGNRSTVDALKTVLARKTDIPHAMLFTGSSGCGKTTLGRIVANHLGCADIDFREIDAGGERGIDAIREIRIQARLRPIGGPVRVWLLDEAHSYLGPAQNALLKILEDTPPHVYFILCTTDPEKLLKTIKSRCMQFNVAPLSEKQMTRLLKRIVEAEGVTDFPEAAYQLIHQNSLGHVRAALVILDKVIDLPAQKLLAACEQAAGEEAQVIDLCRALIKGEKWGKVSALLRPIQESQEAESVRYAVLGYMNSVLLKEDNPRVFLVMEAFREPFYNTGKPGLTFACYEAVKL